MNAAAPVNKQVRIEEYARLPDDGYRTELVRGQVVREPQPGYRHGNIQARLTAILIRHIDENGLQLVCVGPVGFVLARDPATIRGPDVAVLRRARVPEPDHARFVDGAPDLAIEILSPSNSPVEIAARIDDYLGAGGQQVWVVDPEARNVVVHTTAPKTLSFGPDAELDGGDALPGLRIRMAEIFGA